MLSTGSKTNTFENYMNTEEFAQVLNELIALKHELRGVECKPPGPRTDKKLQASVIRAMLGMANHRDGGLVIIGVEDSLTSLEPVGLSSTDLASWKRYDDLASSAAEYTDPSINFELEIHEYAGNKYVLLIVKEFEDIPVLCKKDYPEKLRKGACYVRSRRKPETIEVPTQEDMRDLLDLATEKRLTKFLTLSKSVGIEIQGTKTTSDKEQFDAQLGDFIRG
jgi:predicted HTH transcriptional regulator